MIDPNDILFSSPSICDSIPGVNEEPVSGNEFVLAEDDWRQLEFVSKDLASVVDDEIAKIRRILKNAAGREIHLRSNPEVPLVNDFSLVDLASSLNVLAEPVGVTYRGASSPIVEWNANELTSPHLTLPDLPREVGVQLGRGDIP